MENNTTKIIVTSFIIGFLTVFLSAYVFNHINPWLGFLIIPIGIYVFYKLIYKQIKK